MALMRGITALAGLQLPVGKDAGNTKVQTSNIKVVARFRPMNSMENVNN
jgi:hypothetical protein